MTLERWFHDDANKPPSAAQTRRRTADGGCTGTTVVRARFAQAKQYAS